MLGIRYWSVVMVLLMGSPADKQASVKDIEDIVSEGKTSCVCPYYATRRAVKQSQVSRVESGETLHS